MNFIQFWHQKGNFSTSNLRFAYFARSKMPFKGIIMFLVMNNTRLEIKIMIILDFYHSAVYSTYIVQRLNLNSQRTVLLIRYG